MLPDGSGFDVLKAVRAFSQAPVIILTAGMPSRTRSWAWSWAPTTTWSSPSVRGSWWPGPGRCSAGCGAQEDQASAAQVLGGIELLPAERTVRVDGALVDLTPKEFELLHYLLVNRGLALTRERLLEEVWGYSAYGDARTVDVHIGQLRKKLGAWGRVVQTVWGLGYKADPEAAG